MPARPDEALSTRLRQDLVERLTERKDNIFWTGVAFAVVGILALLFPFFTTMTVAFMIGWVLIFAGAVAIYGAFSVQGTGPFFGPECPFEFNKILVRNLVNLLFEHGLAADLGGHNHGAGRFAHQFILIIEVADI